ncbi:MAG: PQQ-binding-like beta-propeller repeat protein [Bryobacteraceae bacterium]|nr:PQQ-binding-like beta-propeller repeat protein [Bryobacteraceae bacterium]
MADDTVYISTPLNRAVALDAESGRLIWIFDPLAYREGPIATSMGFIHRGIALWRNPQTKEARILLNSRHRLYSIDAANGQQMEEFGNGGFVDLSQELGRRIFAPHRASTSPPLVYRDLVIVGNSVSDIGVYPNDPPGHVRAYDIRTGKIVWKFHTIPQDGETGNDSWERGSWRTAGHVNVWAPMSVDTDADMLYLPVSAPSNDYYGGRRLGDNLFSDSLVCVQASTGHLKWWYQTVRHDLWDYDPASAPILADLWLANGVMKSVIVLTKTGYIFGFDRYSGEPL